MTQKGYLEGSEMASTFNMLRANDLIWSFVVNNYLLGKEPVPLRSALLELQLDPHAGGHAQLLSAQDVPGEPAGRAGRHHPQGTPIDLRDDHYSRPIYFHPRRPYRAMEEHLCGDPDLFRPDQVRTVRLGPYRRDRQSAGGGKYCYWTNSTKAEGPGGLAARRPNSTRVRGGRIGKNGSPNLPASRSNRAFRGPIR